MKGLFFLAAGLVGVYYLSRKPAIVNTGVAANGGNDNSNLNPNPYNPLTPGPAYTYPITNTVSTTNSTPFDAPNVAVTDSTSYVFAPIPDPTNGQAPGLNGYRCLL